MFFIRAPTHFISKVTWCFNKSQWYPMINCSPHDFNTLLLVVFLLHIYGSAIYIIFIICYHFILLISKGAFVHTSCSGLNELDIYFALLPLCSRATRLFNVVTSVILRYEFPWYDGIDCCSSTGYSSPGRPKSHVPIWYKNFNYIWMMLLSDLG